jgi:hypothetical protein
MATTLGLVGVGTFQADERPKNWREGILRLYPNGQASLTALLALMASEATSDPEFSWWEKSLPTRSVFINNGAGYGAGITTFTVDNGAGADPGTILRAGYVLKNMRTKEQMVVSADQAAGTSVDVLRAQGETAAAALLDDDELRVIGNLNEEGGPLPTSIHVDPTKQFNYTQIFRTALWQTRTARKTRLRTEEAKRQAKIEALELESIDMELALLWGERLETTGPLGQPQRATRGVVRWIEANAAANDNTATANTLDETELVGYLETIYRYGSTEKLWLCGSTALNVLTQIAKTGSQLQIDSGTESVYGIRLKRFMTAFGDGLIKQHPLFNLYSDWRQAILILDLANLKYRYVDDLMYLRNRQSPGDDAAKDEFLAECGLELHHAQTHGLIRGIQTFG